MRTQEFSNIQGVQLFYHYLLQPIPRLRKASRDIKSSCKVTPIGWPILQISVHPIAVVQCLRGRGGKIGGKIMKILWKHAMFPKHPVYERQTESCRAKWKINEHFVVSLLKKLFFLNEKYVWCYEIISKNVVFAINFVVNMNICICM